MIIYDYKCEHCKRVEAVHKSYKDVERKEKCPICSRTMQRIYSSNTIKTSDGRKWGENK